MYTSLPLLSPFSLSLSLFSLSFPFRLFSLFLLLLLPFFLILLYTFLFLTLSSSLPDAAFSKRLGTETEVEVIGGADKYVAVCRDCFLDTTGQDTPKARKAPSPALSLAVDAQRKLFSSP